LIQDRNTGMSTYRKIFLWMALSLGCVLSVFSAGGSNEYNVKAMFILNFMKYVEWPSESAGQVFRIGVAGESEIYPALMHMASNRPAEGKRVEIKKVTLDDAPGCQIIFVPREEVKSLAEWISRYNGKGVLIVTEDAGQKSAQAAINLVTVDNKIRFDINSKTARACGVRISSRLINLAREVIN
jgi:hypothetical protein